MEIKIQKDYWEGTLCIENEVPWLPPNAIHYLDALCKNTTSVLEIGSGGSTLFLSRRCNSVFSIETNKDHFNYMSEILKKKKITNVTYLLIENQKDIEAELLSLTGEFDMASVDSVHGYNRSAFLDIILNKLSSLSVIVLDNYADPALFPQHYNKSIEDLTGSENWWGMDFNDPHWCGKGTRILVTKKRGS